MIERSQAVQFVDVFKSGGRQRRGYGAAAPASAICGRCWPASSASSAPRRRSQRFEQEISSAARSPRPRPIRRWSSFVERQLAGAIGAASARIMVASVLREEMHDIDEVTRILDEASQLVVYSRRLEDKSKELEAATQELRGCQ